MVPAMATTANAMPAHPPLRGSVAADVCIIGGGYTGLWTAWFLAERAPSARIVLLEQDICGGGPSGAPVAASQRRTTRSAPPRARS